MYLSPNRIAIDVAATSKKRALEEVAKLLALGAPTASQADILGSLSARERLGVTGLGYGVAIPHGRLAALSNGVGALIRLKHAIDYGAADNQFVDLIFGYIIPQQASAAHLADLAMITDVFEDEDFRARARAAQDAAALFKLTRRT